MNLRALAVLLVVSLMFAPSCRRGAHRDGAPVEAPEPRYAVELLPDASRVAFAVRIEAFESLMTRDFGMSPDQVARFWEEVPPVFSDLFGPDNVDGVDRGARHVIAVSTAGHESLIAALRAGTAIEDAAMLPSEVHLRLILETAASEAVAEQLRGRCEARTVGQGCGEFISSRAFERFLRVDLFLKGREVLSADDERARRLVEGLERRRGSGETPAWRAFEEAEAALAIYATLSELYDLGAFEQALRATQVLDYAVVEDPADLYGPALEAISAGFTFDSAEVAEVEDMTLRLGEDGGRVFIDFVGSLTPYGARLEELGRAEAPLHALPAFDGLVDLRWAFDVESATDAAALPLWAQIPDGMGRDVFVDELRNRYRGAGGWVNLMYLHYPVTSLKVGFDLDAPLLGPPPEARFLRGLHLRAGLGPDGRESPEAVPSVEHLVGALSVVTAVGAAGDGTLEMLRPMLGDFGVPSDSRATVYDDHRAYLLSIGATVEEIFADADETMAAGTQLVVHLAGLNALSHAVAPTDDTKGMNRDRFVDRFPRLFYSSRTVGNQWLIRLQFGGDALELPGLVEK